MTILTVGETIPYTPNCFREAYIRGRSKKMMATNAEVEDSNPPSSANHLCENSRRTRWT